MSILSNRNTSNTAQSGAKQSKTVAEVGRRRWQHFFLSFILYVLGFVLLYLIGQKLNQNAYHPLAFFAPLCILIGMSIMVWSMVSPPKQ